MTTDNHTSDDESDAANPTRAAGDDIDGLNSLDTHQQTRPPDAANLPDLQHFGPPRTAQGTHTDLENSSTDAEFHLTSQNRPSEDHTDGGDRTDTGRQPLPTAPTIFSDLQHFGPLQGNAQLQPQLDPRYRTFYDGSHSAPARGRPGDNIAGEYHADTAQHASLHPRYSADIDHQQNQGFREPLREDPHGSSSTDVPPNSFYNETTLHTDTRPYVDVIERIQANDPAGRPALTYEQLLHFSREQRQLISRLQTYGPPPPMDTANRPQQLAHLRTPILNHPEQDVYELTRSAAAALRPPPAAQGSRSGGDPHGGAGNTLSNSAIAQLTKALERTSNQVKLPKFDGKPTSWIAFRDDFTEYYTAKGWQATVEHSKGPGDPTAPSPNFNYEHNNP